MFAVSRGALLPSAMPAIDDPHSHELTFAACDTPWLAFFLPGLKVADGGDRTGGDVIASIFSVLFGAMMLGHTAPGIATLGIARRAAVEVFEVLERVPPIDSSSEKGIKPKRVNGHVFFDRVSFSYVSGSCACPIFVPPVVL